MLQWFPGRSEGRDRKGLWAWATEWAIEWKSVTFLLCVCRTCSHVACVCFLLGYTLTGASRFGSNRSGRVLTVCPECRPISFPPYFNFRKKECNDGHRIGQVDSADAEWCHRALAPCIRKVIWHSADKMYSVFGWSRVWLPVSEKATGRFVLERKIY